MMNEQQLEINNKAIQLIDSISKLDNTAVLKSAEFLKTIDFFDTAVLVKNFGSMLDSRRGYKDSDYDMVEFKISLQKKMGIKRK